MSSFTPTQSRDQFQIPAAAPYWPAREANYIPEFVVREVSFTLVGNGITVSGPEVPFESGTVLTTSHQTFGDLEPIQEPERYLERLIAFRNAFSKYGIIVSSDGDGQWATIRHPQMPCLTFNFKDDWEETVLYALGTWNPKSLGFNSLVALRSRIVIERKNEVITVKYYDPAARSEQ